MKLISIVIPCHNEEDTVELLYDEIVKYTQHDNFLFELIFVDDGSKDKTVSYIKDLRRKDKAVSLISFSRNFGKESAMLAGMEYAKGDAVIIMDADLQHPPKLIPLFLEGWNNEGYDVVYARRMNRNGEPQLRSWLSRMFYKVINRISDIELEDGIVDFRLMDRKVIDSILTVKERHRFSKGLFAWAGYESKYIDFENVERVAGNTTWNISGLFHYAIEGIISFTVAPLRIATYVGLGTSILSFLYILYTIFDTVINGNPVSGYASTITLILFFGGMQSIFLGIIGEYLGRIFYETKSRPHYFIKEYIGSGVDLVENKISI